MKLLRKTIRKIILESQMSREAKIIELITSWDMPSVDQALMLGESLGMFIVAEESSNAFQRSICLEKMTPEFRAAFAAHPEFSKGRRTQEHPKGEPYGIRGKFGVKGGSMWYTSYPIRLWVNIDVDPYKK